MADRTVSVILQARITDYMAKFSAASKATDDFAAKVAVAKGRSAQGFHAIGVAGVAMGAVVAGGFALAVKEAANFDAKMALVRTLSHATADEMSQLSAAALHVGQAYGFTAGQVADAEAELVKAGVSVADIMGGALTGALTLASAGQTDVATATTIAATAMTQFQLSGKDVPHIADLLAAGADKALGSVVDLGYALDQAGPQAHQFHVSLEETVGTLAAFAQSGQIGERGGTIFTQMLLKLAAPGKQSSDILKQLGINIYGTNGQFVGMANLAGQLQTKLSGLTEAERNHDLAVIFGQRAIRGANILYQDGAKGIEDWTKKVDTQGFAALQAAGKLDSLTGDLTKFKAALQTAFIGAGQGSQGPLRTLVQGGTEAVQVWSELPGPVRLSAEALTALAGTTVLVGGAALLFIPRWTAMNLALKETQFGAISASRALGFLGKTGGVVLGLTAVAEATLAIDRAIGPTAADVTKLKDSLITLSETGQIQGQLLSTFGPDLKNFKSEIDNLLSLGGKINSSWLNRANPVTLVQRGIQHLFGVDDPTSDAEKAKADFQALDKSLADLVTGGHAPIAAQAFSQIQAKAAAAGVSTTDLAKALPQYAAALSSSAESAREAGNGIDQFGNKLGTAAKKTASATQAAKNYGNALHALADPLFAMNQALQGVADAQATATAAVHKYGVNSPQARQANLDLASSALDAEAAARTLAAAVKDGSVSIGDARQFLRAWVADGLLTRQQAKDVAASFDILIGKAEQISGLHPHMTVTADTSQAQTALNNLLDTYNRIGPSGASTASVLGHELSGMGTPAGGSVPVKSPKTPHTVLTVPTDTSGLYAGHVPGSGSGSSTRPPTVQEIVQAILNGTIPPSIDKLSKTLQTEIRNLSTIVGSAEQYNTQVRSSLLGYASLSNNNGGTDLFGNPTTVSVNSYLKGRYAQLKEFVGLRQRLVGKGAGEGLLEEFDAIGPTANPMMKQLLAQGRQGIRQANRYETRITRLAGQEAGVATSDKYGGQIVELLQRAPQEEARLIAKALARQHIYVNITEQDRHQARKVHRR